MRTLLAAVAALGLAAGAGHAAAGVPSEPPPDGFGGRQYVDSAGCVFVRAEVAGATTWVPRLNKSREHICGFPPTFASDVVVQPASAQVAVEVRPETRPEIVPVNAQPVAAVSRPVLASSAVRTAAPTVRSGLVKGYRPVWKDDRLNPQRGPRSVVGDEMMRRVWTDEVPMRLVAP